MPYSKLFAREYSVQYSQTALRALRMTLGRLVPTGLRTTLIVPEQSNEAYYAETREWNLYLSGLEQKFKNHQTQKRFIKNFDYWGKLYVQTARRLGQRDFGKVSNQALAQRYRIFIRYWDIYTAYLAVGFFLNDLFSKKFEQSLKSLQLPQAILTALLTPAKKVGVLILQNRLQTYKKHRRQRLPPIALKKLLNQFAWMSCLDIQNDPWQLLDIEKFYQQIESSKKSLSFPQALRQAKLNSSQLSLAKAVRNFIYVKEMRDVYRRQGILAILPLFNEIAKRLKVTRVDLAYATNEELIAALLGRTSLDVKLPHQRQRGFLMTWAGRKITISTNQKQIRLTLKKINQQNLTTVTGTVAHPGLVMGPVKIIHTVKDLTKVNKADILAAITTHPDFIVAMRKAAAIITDEGGLTSHAALVAREFGIPCIVGTKNATKIFKDSDLVEVNANTGLVKKL